MINKEKKFNILYFIVLLGLLFFAHWRNPFDSDEGLILDGAWNLWHGRELYTDFFEFIPPGSFYLVWLIFKFLPIDYFSVKFISLLIFWAGTIGIFQISKILSKSKLVYLGPFILVSASFFWPIINHNIYNLCLLIWSSFFFINFLEKKNINFLLAAGFSAVLALLFLQQKGLALIFTQGVFLLIYSYLDDKKNILKNISFYVLPIFLVMFFIFLKWPPLFLYEKLMSFVWQNYIEVNKMSYAIMNFFLLLTLLVAIILKRKKSPIIYYLLGLQFVLLLTTFSRPDNYHVLLVAFPLFSLLPEIFQWIIKIPFQPLKYTILMTSILLLSLMILPSLLFISTNPAHGKKSPFYELVNYLKQNCPGENDLYVGPFIPGLYFETGKLNPTPYYILMTGFQDNSFFETAKNYLEKNPPRCIVMNYQIVEKFKYDRNNQVDNFIAENYNPAFKFYNDEIFIKK